MTRNDGLADPAHPTEPGPPLGDVMQRIALAPADCVPAPGTAVAAPALVVDTADAVAPGVVLTAQDLRYLRAFFTETDPGVADVRGRSAALTTWVLLDPALDAALHPAPATTGSGREPRARAAWVVSTVYKVAAALAPALDPHAWPTTTATREEAARGILRAAGLHPAGETAASADARWQTVSTAVQRHVLAEMAEEARRSQELAEQLRQKRAREAAAQVSHV